MELILNGKGSMHKLVVFLLALMLPAHLQAQEFTVETVVEGLSNPCGVAVQPGTGHVFVSESGAGRIVRIVDDKIESVIQGFPLDSYGTSPELKIGPLGLAFTDQDTLVVGSGGNPENDHLAIYKIPEPESVPLEVTAHSGKPQSLPADSERGIPAEGDFYGVAMIGEMVFVTCQGDDTKGWLSSAEVVDGELTSFKRTIATKEKTGVDAPLAITRSPEGYLVVSQMGETDASIDSVLAFYDQSNEELVDWRYETGLNDIVALAYGPKRGRLFAADICWSNPSAGALYKLVGESPNKCRAIKITGLERPTAMSFDSDGNLFVTVMGLTSEGAETPSGKLLKISGLDDAPK